MGLLSTIETAVANAFNAFNTSLGDAVVSFVYEKNVPLFDENTNTVTNTTTTVSSRGVFSRYQTKIIDDEAYFDTRIKVVFLQKEFDGTPEQDAKIIADGQTYIIEKVTKDPVSAIWVLQCRE